MDFCLTASPIVLFRVLRSPGWGEGEGVVDQDSSWSLWIFKCLNTFVQKFSN
jgi:hypothetical protein